MESENTRSFFFSISCIFAKVKSLLAVKILLDSILTETYSVCCSSLALSHCEITNTE